MEEALGPFHVPQHSRRVKLRITPPTADPNLDLHSYLFSAADPPPQHLHSSASTASHGGEVIAVAAPALSSDAGVPASIAGALNLSLATHGRSVQQVSGGQRSGRSTAPVAVTTAPVGPFTGYASILTRSRFLSPAEELLEDFCGMNRGRVSDLAAEKARVLVASAGENWSQKVADRCSDSNLLSILHEVYKRYKLYHQQMQSAVSSFESVAGLANAAPFISFAIKAVSKHFHCLKKAILDYIDFTNPASRDSSAFVSSHHRDQRPLQQLQYRGSVHHPAWRSQRGFPEKAVAVLRTWLFENFLHPYPTDTDKEMLARRTGLSRNQVSNWFTNARVRLWKPMVEEIHTLEKQAHFPSEPEHRKLVNVLADHFSSATPHPPEKPSSLDWIPRLQENESRVATGQVSQVPPQPDLYLVGPNKTETDKRSGSSGYGGAGDGSGGLAWSNCGQTLPFWLAK